MDIEHPLFIDGLSDEKYLSFEFPAFIVGKIKSNILTHFQGYGILLKNIELNVQVILIDDVLYTGRTIRAAMDALLDFGRASKVELCVLVDRRFNRQLPIQPDYTGKTIDSILSQKVTVDWEKPEVVLL